MEKFSFASSTINFERGFEVLRKCAIRLARSYGAGGQRAGPRHGYHHRTAIGHLGELAAQQIGLCAVISRRAAFFLPQRDRNRGSRPSAGRCRERGRVGHRKALFVYQRDLAPCGSTAFAAAITTSIPAVALARYSNCCWPILRNPATTLLLRGKAVKVLLVSTSVTAIFGSIFLSSRAQLVPANPPPTTTTPSGGPGAQGGYRKYRRGRSCQSGSRKGATIDFGSRSFQTSA